MKPILCQIVAIHCWFFRRLLPHAILIKRCAQGRKMFRRREGPNPHLVRTFRSRVPFHIIRIFRVRSIADRVPLCDRLLLPTPILPWNATVYYFPLPRPTPTRAGPPSHQNDLKPGSVPHHPHLSVPFVCGQSIQHASGALPLCARFRATC